MENDRTKIETESTTDDDVNDHQAEKEKTAPLNRLWVAVDNRIIGDILSALNIEYQLTAVQSRKVYNLLVKKEAESYRESLLIAISLGKLQLVREILSRFDQFEWQEDEGCAHSVSFEPHMTPLMLACICNQTDVVELLLNRGHRIETPHDIKCICDKCKQEKQMTSDSVANEMSRIDVYRALCSHSYLWLANSDPLLSSFELVSDLRNCVSAEPACKKLYESMLANVESFAEQVVQQCWTAEEIGLLLDNQTGVHLSSAADMPSPRLRLALDARMKSFLASMNVQMVLRSRWMGDWSDWGSSPAIDWCVRFPKHTIFYPITAFLFAITGGALFGSYRNPYCRFLSFFVSYLTFLLALVVVAQSNEGTEAVTRGFAEWPKLQCQIYVFIYALGMIVRNYLSFCRRGLLLYFDQWWNWFDFLFWALFLFAFIMWIRAVQQANADGLYWLHRRHWTWHDARLIYEAFFASACIVAFWRLFYFVKLSRMIGPTVISIGRCIRKIVQYLLITLVVMAAFAHGLNIIYEPYKGNRFVASDGSVLQQSSRFSSFTASLWGLYWSFYGYVWPVEYDIVAGQAGPDQQRVEHYLTQFAGEAMSAVYHSCVNITMLNLIISLIANTCNQVLLHEDVEWKFNRCSVWVEFFEPGNSVPPPFNLIYMISMIVRNCWNPLVTFSWPELFHKAPIIEKDAQQKYQQLIVRLFRRYRAGIRRSQESFSDGVSVTLAQMQAYISILRFVKYDEDGWTLFSVSLMIHWRSKLYKMGPLKSDLRAAVDAIDKHAVFTVLHDDFQLTAANATKICCLLIKKEDESCREALLMAISLGKPLLVVAVLVEFDYYGWKEDAGCTRSLTYEPHMTPLMLACICNRLDIVELLLRRGHRIEEPHAINCVCEQCDHNRQTGELVGNSMKRIDVYRAISSHAYLWLAHSDPLLACFELAGHLQQCTVAEQEINKLYESMLANVESFAEQVVQQCWTTEEVASLLDNQTGVHLSSTADIHSPRLRLALDARMKSFLASMNVQMVLRSRWMGDWSNWGDSPAFDWCVRFPQHTIFYPITALLCAITGGKLIPSYRNPYCRFVSFLVSYMTFLIALVIVSQLNENENSAFRGIVQKPFYFLCQMYVWLYAMGMILRNFCSFCRLGFRSYFNNWWNWFDFLLWALFLFAFIMWIRVAQLVSADGLYELHRRHWTWYDARLIYEAFFAGACIVAFWRFFYFLQLSRMIGPTVISIGRCIGNIAHYLFISSVVIAAFVAGINFVYEPYNGNRVFDVNGTIEQLNALRSDVTGMALLRSLNSGGTERIQPNLFRSSASTLRYLHWALYGYVQPVDLHILAGQTGPELKSNDHWFTQLCGESLFAVYHVVIILTLLKLIVSLMVRTADQVLENANIDWKYILCHIWAEFFEPNNTVPPPFNLIYLVSTTISDCFNPNAKFSWPDLFYIEPKIASGSTKKYQELLVRLFLRYRSSRTTLNGQLNA